MNFIISDFQSPYFGFAPDIETGNIGEAIFLTGEICSHRINPVVLTRAHIASSRFDLYEWIIQSNMAKDLRKYAKQTNTRLILGGLLILFILGDGLIYVFYGGGAAFMGLVCLFAGLFPLLLIWLALVGLDWFSRRANRE